MSALSDLILADNAGPLGRMLAHPFVTRIAQGQLSDAAYHRYLVYEGAFVETAISIFAYATAKAPDLEAKRWMIGVQSALAHEQMPYFERSFAELGVDTGIAIPPAVRAFDEGMLAIARDGSFSQIVTAMFAAEWMYWTWCRKAAAGTIANPHIRQWLDLHADEGFAAQAQWLKSAIDRYAAPGGRDRLSRLFGHVMELEIAFHDAPLAGEQDDRDA